MPDPARLVPLRPADLDPEQQEFWRALGEGARGAKAVRPEGFLTGPFDVLLRSPRVGGSVAGLGELLRFESDLEQRHRELAIIVVAARWRARYAWLRHNEYARDAGIEPEAVAAIAEGRPARFERAEDQTVYDLVHALAHTGLVPDGTYQAALDLLGERSLVELVALAGYSSFLLNTFRVPLPEGERVPWDPA